MQSCACAQVLKMPTPDQIKKLHLTPEQVGRDDRSVDVWAVGVLVFECLAGSPPPCAQHAGY